MMISQLSMVRALREIDCWFSGGKDSALACYIAYRVAKMRGWDFRLVYIDTTVAIPANREYVGRYARWLGAEMVVLRPRHSFKELLAKYPYWPLIYGGQKYRWCYHHLKRTVADEYMCQHKEDIHVLGIRGEESLFRERRYTKTFEETDKPCGKIKLWLPLVRVSSIERDRLIKQFRIPESPVWRIGISGDCLCLAGTTRRTLDKIIAQFPDAAQMLIELDDIVHQYRRSKTPSYPKPMLELKQPVRLKDYILEKLRQPTLDDYLDYRGKECAGYCLL